jgi:hypothetical protein
MNKDFSKENIDKLNKQQQSVNQHQYTCGGSGHIPECKRQLSYDKRFKGEQVDFTNENEGVLIATENGWVCPCGKYTQDWFY